VTTAEGDIATKASAASVTALTATVGEITADARLKMEVVTGPTGYARIGARVRYGTSGSYWAAGWYLDVPSDPGADTQFVIEADRFVLIDGSTKKVPFRVDGGSVFIDDLKVGTSNIDPGAVTTYETGSLADGSMDGFRTITITVSHGDRANIPGLLIRIDAQAVCVMTIVSGDTASSALTIIKTTGTNQILSQAIVTGRIYETHTLSTFATYIPPTGQTSTTFQITLSHRGSYTDVVAFAQAFKK
ncbi:MAG TPA: DUF1983 domain-containing protein, partial [Pararhizobium sp.]|uniref:phage tail tip fiber protein n=1 Tax=Pararhizobium sp. TaxID=1977563 RepID=UPI002CB2F176